MPPINPPTLQKQSYSVLPSDLINSVVIPAFNCSIISGSLKSDGTYDGETQIQYQGEDGSWNQIIDINNNQDINARCDNMFAKDPGVSGTWEVIAGASRTKFPLNIRVIVLAQATTGKCDVEIDYL